jgi:ArsR family transcriptional regulator
MEANYDELTGLFKAMGHPARLQILDILRRGEVCVCHIEAALQRRQAYVSQQLMTLREAGLVDSRQEGVRVFYRLADGPVLDLLRVVLGPLEQEDPDQFVECSCPICTEERQRLAQEVVINVRS